MVVKFMYEFFVCDYCILLTISMGTGSFPGVKSGRGVKLTPHPF